MAYPGEYRRDQYYGEDGHVEGGNYSARGYQSTEGYGRPAYSGDGYGDTALPLFTEQVEHHKHGHHHRPEYVPEGYPSRAVQYVQPQASDLGMGLRDSEISGADYSAGHGGGYGGNQLGYSAPAAYGPGGYAHGRTEQLEEDLKHERRRAHEAEAAAAAATAYAVHERHGRKESEDGLERYEPVSEHKHHHRFFNFD